MLQFNEPDYAELLVAVDMYEESIVYVHENPDATGTIELAQGLLDIDGRIKEAQLLNNGLPARILVELDESAERKLNLISSKINKPPIFRGLILSNLASFFGGEGGTVPELLFEKKRLIPALQQLLVSS